MINCVFAGRTSRTSYHLLSARDGVIWVESRHNYGGVQTRLEVQPFHAHWGIEHKDKHRCPSGYDISMVSKLLLCN